MDQSLKPRDLCSRTTFRRTETNYSERLVPVISGEFRDKKKLNDMFCTAAAYAMNSYRFFIFYDIELGKWAVLVPDLAGAVPDTCVGNSVVYLRDCPFDNNNYLSDFGNPFAVPPKTL